MAARSDAPVRYFCTACRIETLSAKACPKCHRKTTLERVGGAAEPRRSSGRVRATSGAVPVARRPPWIWIGAGVVAVAVVVVVVIALGGSKKPVKAGGKKQGAGMATMFSPPARTFGAAPKGKRTGPPPAPRVCGVRYELSIATLFPKPGPDASMKPAGMKAAGMRPAGMKAAGMKAAGPKPAGMKPAGMKPRPGRRRPHPERLSLTQELLLVNRPGGRLGLVFLRIERAVTLGGKTQKVLALHGRGALVPNPKTRRIDRRGFDAYLFPGTRVSDVIGRVQAELAGSPQGLKIVKAIGPHRFVRGLVSTAIGAANFLQPRPPKPKLPFYDDERKPPPALIGGADVALVRRFRRPAKAGAPWKIEPLRRRRTSVSAPAATGTVLITAGEALPRSAALRITGVPRRKGTGPVTVEIKLVHRGSGCSS